MPGRLMAMVAVGLIHHPILQNGVDGIWMGAFGKFLFIGTVTTVLSFLLTWIVRMIPGIKKVL